LESRKVMPSAARAGGAGEVVGELGGEAVDMSCVVLKKAEGPEAGGGVGELEGVGGDRARR
jgi:hypothetical protein